MKTQRVALPIGLVVAASAMAGCASSDDKRSDDGYSVLNALAQIPADEAFPNPVEARLISTGDLRAATELVDVSWPESLESDEFATWINSVTGGPSSDIVSPIYVPPADVLGLRTFELETQVDDEVGWSLLDIDSYVEQRSPGQVFSVIQGESLEAFDGTRSGERPLFVASEGNRFAVSRLEEPVEAWASGLDSSLADDERFSPIASTLDSAGVVGAIIQQPAASWPDWLERQRQAVADSADLDGLAAHLPDDGGPVFGVGWSASSGGEPVTTLVYHFGNEDAATAATPVLETLFTEEGTSNKVVDFLTLTEIRSDGPVVAVTVSPADGQPASIVAHMFSANNSALPFL